MRHAAILIPAFATLLGCSGPAASGPSPEATDHLTVNFTEIGTPESCEFKMYSTIAKSKDLYMYEYRRAATGKSKFPAQLQFTSHDGIDYARDTTESGVLMGAPCKSYDIVWQNPECKSNDRATIECPEVRFNGAEIFNSVTVESSAG